MPRLLFEVEGEEAVGVIERLADIETRLSDLEPAIEDLTTIVEELKLVLGQKSKS